MKKIIRGVHSFQRDVFSSQQELFQRLAGGQSPEALFITCSDSRIDPALVTQTEPGELFILRNAGNIIPPFGASTGGEAAAVEFAVAGLIVQDIIVCGHSHCGAIQGLLNPDKLSSLPVVAEWLRHASATKRILEENYQDETGEQLLANAIKENVLVQLENLRTHPAVAARLAKEQLTLHAWVYEFENGQISAYDREKRRFAPLAAAEA